MNDKAALIEELHTICAYRERAAELFAAMEKEQPEGLRWLEGRLAQSYEERRAAQLETLPKAIAELPKAEWAVTVREEEEVGPVGPLLAAGGQAVGPVGQEEVAAEGEAVKELAG
jgi:hypothetical protein